MRISKKTVSLSALLFAFVWLALLSWQYARPVYNGTDSMPKGLYLLNTAERDYRLDQIVMIIYHAPDWALERKYNVPDRMQFVKRIKALPGDRLKMEGRKIFRCNEECSLIAERLEMDKQGRQFPPVELPEIVPEGKVFLATDHARSFDSRYLGLFSLEEIIGTAKLFL